MMMTPTPAAAGTSTAAVGEEEVTRSEHLCLGTVACLAHARSLEPTRPASYRDMLKPPACRHLAQSSFIDLGALLSGGRPVMDLSYLIDTVMNDVCPLDWQKASHSSRVCCVAKAAKKSVLPRPCLTRRGSTTG